MDAFRILLAQHGPQAGSDLSAELRSRGWLLDVTHNLAETWALARDASVDAILLIPLSSRPEEPELASLVELAEAPDGPALLVLTEQPARLESLAEHLDDFLAPDDGPDVISRRLRFSIARRRALARLHRESESLRSATTTDFKTGLRNDRYFDERCRIESARAAREGRCLGLLLLDLDTFKAINDDHGHPFADRVLAEVGRVLQQGLRPFDTAARIGGDEFAVLLPDAGPRDVRRIGERLRVMIEAMTFDREGVDIGVTVSIGAASWDPLANGTFDASLRGADGVLRAAKRAGRNRVLIHDGPAGDEVASSAS